MSTLAWSPDLRATFQLLKNQSVAQIESLSKLNATEKHALMVSVSDKSLNIKSSNATIQNIWM